MNDTSENETWTPSFKLDLRTAKPKEFDALKTEFERWRKANPPQGPLPWETGWVTVTPQVAEQMLLRNPLDANREAVFSQVKYYAAQMERDDWKATGQPIIFLDNGNMGDGGHRTWGGYLSGSTFRTYVITGIEAEPRLFAYLDNGKSRTLADALATSGMNGLSTLMVQTLLMAEAYELGGYTTSVKKQGLPRMSPAQMVLYADQHPNLRRAVTLAAGEYRDTVDAAFNGHKKAAAFTAMTILDLYDEVVLEEFFEDLGQVDAWPDDSPLTVLQHVMQKDRRADDPMKSHQILGYAIKTFNAWKAGESIPRGRMTLKVDEAFPAFNRPAPAVAEAAE